MSDAINAETTNGTTRPRLVDDRVVAEETNLSRGFLQKDRIGAQLVPFIKVGDRCLYDLDAVFDALRQYQRGGPGALPVRARPRKVKAASIVERATPVLAVQRRRPGRPRKVEVTQE